jgi:hydantoinase/carbamoylase family amidase
MDLAFSEAKASPLEIYPETCQIIHCWKGFNVIDSQWGAFEYAGAMMGGFHVYDIEITQVFSEEKGFFKHAIEGQVRLERKMCSFKHIVFMWSDLFMTEYAVNGQRLWNNILELGKIGTTTNGVSRVSFSLADMEARRWLLEKMQTAGLDAHIDHVGNVLGSIPSSSTKKILVGSHLDTVPNGGMFDGALGVLAALECAQTMKEHNVKFAHGIQVAAFSNEEGTQAGGGLFGSRYFAEGISEAEQELVGPVIKKAGLMGIGPAGSQRPFQPSEYVCYLELHIEQGGVLDSTKEHIGVVEGIVGIHNLDIAFKGVPNHAGTTPMAQRKDALLGAVALILEVPGTVREYGSDFTVGTCGQVDVFPGARNVIPGYVRVSIEVRDLEPDVADRVLEALMEKARNIARSRQLDVELTPVSKTPSAKMDSEIQAVIFDAATSLGFKARPMPSGASHDAAVFAKYLPTAMIFVPSRHGISHSPDEWTGPEDCINGANVLLRTLLRLAM